ncbi:MAG: proline racemase family protein [Candidatus Bipolaricaulis sp.]|nr:proline racemase family protein [Candidatus Bipolaricaulis sp.]
MDARPTAEERRKLSDWGPRGGWPTFRTVDLHTAGEPLRIVTDGFPELRGETMLERRRDAQQRYDGLRRILMWEPRGHADMYGCLVTPPTTDDADFGVLFMHNEGWSTMCGHGVIAVTTAAVELGWIPPREPETTVRIDAPPGRITAAASVEGARVRGVRFRNVPSFVLARDEMVDVSGVGRVRYDIAFGGAFYAYVDAGDVGFRCVPEEIAALISVGRAIKRAVMATREVPHPIDADLGFLYGVIFTAPALGEGADMRNVCIFADGEVDRSPTGTGVSGRMALQYARGEVALGQPLVIESILGTRFTGRVVEESTCGPYAAVVPEVGGNAHITGRQTLVVDPDDPLKEGFLLR